VLLVQGDLVISMPCWARVSLRKRLYADAIANMNASQVPVIAVDKFLPAQMPTRWWRRLGRSHALDAIVSFTAPVRRMFSDSDFRSYLCGWHRLS